MSNLIYLDDCTLLSVVIIDNIRMDRPSDTIYPTDINN